MSKSSRENERSNLKNFQLSFLFLIARLIMVVSLPLVGLKSYGDFWNFYNLASLGRPFLDLWIEFPPLFPVLSRALYLIVDGKEHSFIYALIVIFSIFQAGNIYLLQKIARIVNPEKEIANRALVYVFLILGLFYGWAYFDSIAVFCLLFGLYLMINNKSRGMGVVLGIGGLIKWFPLLVLPAAWKWLGAKKTLVAILVVIVVVGLGWGILFGLSPEFTKASLFAQGAKGSWETVWALIDGNLTTGNFSGDAVRTLAASASVPSGNPSVIPSWITLLLIGGIGFVVFWRSKIDSAAQIVSFTGFTLILFFLWSPGYSPQWTLYLLPFVVLCFEENRSKLLALILVLVNLLEWPILLSRGWFQLLEEIVLLRTGIFILLAFLFAQAVLIHNGKEKVKN